MRKKCSRLEDDNDSLAMQLKKMATKARGSTCTYSTKLLKNQDVCSLPQLCHF